MADTAFFEGRQITPVPVSHDIYAISPLRTVATKLDCNPVGSISVTPIVQDEKLGDYVREIRIFTQAATGSEPELILSVRLRALTVKALEIVTPPSQF